MDAWLDEPAIVAIALQADFTRSWPWGAWRRSDFAGGQCKFYLWNLLKFSSVESFSYTERSSRLNEPEIYHSTLNLHCFEQAFYFYSYWPWVELWSILLHTASTQRTSLALPNPLTICSSWPGSSAQAEYARACSDCPSWNPQSHWTYDCDYSVSRRSLVLQRLS